LEGAAKLESILRRDKDHAEWAVHNHDWFTGPVPRLQPTYGCVARAYAEKESRIADPTTLIVIDEADRLRMASLEQVRAIFDAQEIGLILIGMQDSRNGSHAIRSSIPVLASSMSSARWERRRSVNCLCDAGRRWE
jgi:hypothetical protein